MTEQIENNETEETPQPELPDDVWKRLRTRDRNKLRAGYTFAICAQAIRADLKIFLLNLAFFGIALIPGPGAVFILPVLVASYFVRWDKTAKKTRAKFGDFFRNGVPLERYKDFIHPSGYKEGEYRVHGSDLLKSKWEVVKQSAIDVNMTALGNLGRIYKATILHPVMWTLNATEYNLGYVIGEERAEKVITPVLNKYVQGEKNIVKGAKFVASKAEKVGTWAEKSAKDSFNAAAAVKSDMAEKMAHGWEYTKDEVKSLFKSEPKP